MVAVNSSSVLISMDAFDQEHTDRLILCQDVSGTITDSWKHVCHILSAT